MGFAIRKLRQIIQFKDLSCSGNSGLERWRAPLFLIIYLFRKCLSRKTCRDGTFHISLAPGTTALEKKTQPLHHPWCSRVEWKTYLEKNSDGDWERVGGERRIRGGESLSSQGEWDLVTLNTIHKAC